MLVVTSYGELSTSRMSSNAKPTLSLSFFSRSYESAGPAAVGFDHFVDFGHQADGFVQGDDDALVVEDVFAGESAAAAVL